MIPIEDLMLGDYVQVTIDNENPFTDYVCGIGYNAQKDEMGIVTNTCGSMDDLIGPYELDPIPLTPEILEKNGFWRSPEWHYCEVDTENYCVIVQLGYANSIEYVRIRELGADNNVPSKKDSLYLVHIKYIHELQHALKLCGINKKIELW